MHTGLLDIQPLLHTTTAKLLQSLQELFNKNCTIDNACSSITTNNTVIKCSLLILCHFIKSSLLLAPMLMFLLLPFFL
uniref:Uncharacterized protein n=1 Tax=Octopus bimaculoides TaxID=37653 RepID=A0A0L8GEM6_OCTBM